MTTLNPYESPRPPAAFSGFSQLPIRATGIVTAEDSLAALKIAGRWRPWRRTLLLVPVLAWVLFVALTDQAVLGWWPALVILLGVLYLLVAPAIFKRRFRKAFQARTEFAQPVTWTFSEEGLLTETIHAKTFRVWGGFAYAKITADRIVLAQPGDAMFNFVPRRLFETEVDWQAVRQLVAAKLAVK